MVHPLALAAPVATILGHAWAFEHASPDVYGRALAAQRALTPDVTIGDSIDNSVAHLVIDMDAACPTAALEALAAAPWASLQGSASEAAAMRALAAYVKELAAAASLRRGLARRRSESASLPPEFLDPIMMTPMLDPVRLPDSGIVVDRATIERHLLETATDPYSRTDLSADDVVPDRELKARIEAWRAGEGAKGPRDASGVVPAERTIASHAPSDRDLDSEEASESTGVFRGGAGTARSGRARCTFVTCLLTTFVVQVTSTLGKAKSQTEAV